MGTPCRPLPLSLTPHRCRIKIGENNTQTETYSAWKTEEKLKDDLFTIPKGK